VNPVFLWAYAHVLLAALVTGSAVMLAVSAYLLRRGSDTELFTRAARLSLVVLTPAILLAMLIGSELGSPRTSTSR
jgi:cytochrome bd ubiquinol oxidase subunit I